MAGQLNAERQKLKAGSARREPYLRAGKVGGGEVVARGVSLQRNFGATCTQECSEARWMVGWHDGIDAAIEEEDAFASERAGRGGLIEHDHWAKENRGAKGFGAKKEKARASCVRT